MFYLKTNIINDKIKFFSSELEGYLIKIVNLVNLENNWSSSQSFEIEIKKSFVRGLIRYSEYSLKINQLAKEIFKERINNSNKFKWVTIPYPMIHLCGDKIEDGGFHYDNDKSKNLLCTCWIPITDYNYPALSLFFSINKFINIIFSKFIKFRILNFFSKNFNVKKGNILIWPGYYIHRGNLNASEKISCAIQFKITNNIYEYEQNHLLQSLNEVTDDFSNDDEKKINNNFNLYNSLVNEVINNNKNLDAFESAKNIISMIDEKSLKFSFSFSTLSQRIISKKKHFSKYKKLNHISITFDLISLLLGSSNLISLKRVLNFYKNDREKIINFLKDYDRLNCVPFNSIQFNKIIGKNDLKNYNIFTI